MTVESVVQNLELKIIAGGKFLDRKISGGYCSDLLSDVMGNSKEDNIWITMQVHKNIMAVATLKDISAIILVNGLQPEKEVIEIAEKEGIPVLGTPKTSFEIAGKLYQLLSKNEPVQG